MVATMCAAPWMIAIRSADDSLWFSILQTDRASAPCAVNAPVRRESQKQQSCCVSWTHADKVASGMWPTQE